MANFRLFGYNPTITTASDPEDIWGSGGSYTFPPEGELPSTDEGVHISSTQDTDCGIPGKESSGARTVRVTALDRNYNEIIFDVDLYGTNAQSTGYDIWRINHMEVTNTGADLKNNGNIHIGIGGVGGGIPSDRTYATILADDLHMLSTVYTIPRGAVLEIDFIEVQVLAAAEVTWSFHAGYAGALKKIAAGFVDDHFAGVTTDTYEFKGIPYRLEGPIDMKVKIDTVSATTGVAATIIGTLNTGNMKTSVNISVEDKNVRKTVKKLHEAWKGKENLMHLYTK